MDWLILVQGGPSVAFLGLLIWVARLIYNGGLVTRATVEDMKANFNQQIQHERTISASWQAVATNNSDALAKILTQTDRLIESQKIIEGYVISVSGSNPSVVREITPGPSRGIMPWE